MVNGRILLLTKYARTGASSRLRSLQYLPFLERNGFSFVVQSLSDDAYLAKLYQSGRRPLLGVGRSYLKRLWLLLRFYRYDLIWIEKEAFPYFPAVAERFLRLVGMPYIVDYDDAIFHNYDLSSNPLVRRLLGRKIDAVMRYASCVVAGNRYLADRAGAAGARRVRMIPTVVDVTRYSEKARPKTTDARPTIGWIGSPSTQRYLLEIREALLNSCMTNNARLMLVGAAPTIVSEFPGIDVICVPWNEESEASLINSMDIGIMPLPSGPWERGKCGYKLIQYMACGVPVVASPVGVNTEIVVEWQCGVLAATNQEWEMALLRLLTLPETRTNFGRNGRRAVEKKYSLQVQAPGILQILSDAADVNQC